MKAISENTRVSIGVATFVSVAGGLVICGVTWGIYSTRLDALEAESNEVRKDARTLEQQQALAIARFDEIIRRLDRLDRKIDWYERRENNEHRR